MDAPETRPPTSPGRPAMRAAEEYGDALASYQRSAILHRRIGDRGREALAGAAPG